MNLYDNPVQINAVIRSLDGKLDQVEVLGKLDDQQYIAKYSGVHCIAIYNVFVGLYYADDKYGILPDDWRNRQ